MKSSTGPSSYFASKEVLRERIADDTAVTRSLPNVARDVPESRGRGL
jgi:hypothetical protein